TYDTITVSVDSARLVSACPRCGAVVAWEGGRGVGILDDTWWIRLGAR
ncbi:unnamed protein product, partial [marine sediment metagenome]